MAKEKMPADMQREGCKPNKPHSVSYKATGSDFKLPDAVLSGSDRDENSPRRHSNPLSGSDLFDLGYDEAFQVGWNQAANGGAAPGKHNDGGKKEVSR